MSLHQRIAERTSSATLQRGVLRAMQGVPHATGLAIAPLADGIRGVLVIGADGETFVAAERAAMDRLREVQHRFRDLTVDLACVPASEADAIELSSAVEVYRYTGSSPARVG
jgi:hypothetical protein